MLMAPLIAAAELSTGSKIGIGCGSIYFVFEVNNSGYIRR